MLRTSLHKHGDFTASWTFTQQVHHLVVAHVLDIPLVDLHQNIPLLKAAAARVVHYLLDPLSSSRQAVSDGEAEPFVTFLHVNGDQLGLGGYGRGQGDHVTGVAAGHHVGWGAVWPRLPQAINGSSLVGRRVKRFLSVDNDWLFVQDRHWGHQAGVGVVGVKGQRVATA